MPSPIFQPEVMEHEVVVGSQHAGLSLPGDADLESRDEENQEALRFAFDQLTMMTTEKVDCTAGGLSDPLDTTGSISDACNSVGGGYVGSAGSLGTPTACSSSSEYYGAGVYPVVGPQSHASESSSALCNRKRGVNMTECVPVPSSEHVAEIVGRQGCKIKALRAKTNTYIKTPVRGEEPVFIVTGRREDVEMAKREILSAAEHFSVIRASRCKAGSPGAGSPPHVPGQTTIQVRVPYRVVGLVVGPKGATIKRIQQQTHTYIVTPSRDKDPVFEVTGMPENVDRAREEIESHIAMRTGAFLDLQGDNDFHSNGTDVSLEGLGSLGLGSVLWSRARQQPASLSLRQAARKAGTSSFGGALSPQMGAGSRAIPEGSSTSAPFSATARYGFSGEVSQGPGTQPADELAFELGASNIWGPLTPGPQQRRDSGGLSGGSATPRLSPTLPPEPLHQEHPLSRRAQSDPLGALSWLQAGNAGTSFSGASSSSSGGSSTGYSSSCSGGSPTDSEGGVVASGLLGRLRGISTTVGGSARDCSICFESEVTAALVPCGHNLFCMDCAGQICQSANPACPECHTPATQCIRIVS